MNEYLFVILSTAIIYFFLISAIVFFGKRELSQLSIIDLVFILLISNAVQNAMVNGDWKSLWLGLISAATLFALNYMLKLLSYRSKWVNRLIEGFPVMLIYDGKVISENLERERIRMNELEAAVREHGVEKISEVSLAILETDGNISVISFGDSKQTIYARKGKKLPPKLKQE